jgi:hypothetical protein
MIPGTVSKLSEKTKASADSVVADADVLLLTGSTTVNTVVPKLTFSQFLILIPVSGALTLGTSGNILAGLAAVQNRAVYLTWVKSLQKWVINSGV